MYADHTLSHLVRMRSLLKGRPFVRTYVTGFRLGHGTLYPSIPRLPRWTGDQGSSRSGTACPNRLGEWACVCMGFYLCEMGDIPMFEGQSWYVQMYQNISKHYSYVLGTLSRESVQDYSHGIGGIVSPSHSCHPQASKSAGTRTRSVIHTYTPY